MTALLELDDVSQGVRAASSSPTTSRSRVAPGEMLGIVGPNGAGKTSVLNLITGNLSPDCGRILLDGADITDARRPTRGRGSGIGRTYQIPRPFGGMTVFENVLLGATYAGRPHGRRAHDPSATAVEALDRDRSDRSRQRARRQRCRSSTASASSWRARSRPARACCSSTRSPAA